TPCKQDAGARSNNSFKPNLLRYINNMAGKACHVVASATQVGLTQALACNVQFNTARQRKNSKTCWRNSAGEPGRRALPEDHVAIYRLGRPKSYRIPQKARE